MLTRIIARSARPLATRPRAARLQICLRCAMSTKSPLPTVNNPKVPSLSRHTQFHTTAFRRAQAPTADEIMENLNELYATAKDEFEIAHEETEGNTIYAQDDRDAARDALDSLQEAFQKAVKESDPEVAKEVTTRVGQRIRELEGAVKAMEERAMEE